MKPFISLILPAYNVESYIENCITSCESQDLPHDSYEIIIVNDGSTDTTSSKIECFSKLYKNIRILNQENSGLSMARNNGVEIANGKYIWFIDSDDTISTNCLANLVKVIEEFDLDALTVGPSIAFKKEFPESFNISDDVSVIYNGKDYILNSGKFVVGAWCYIFKKSFWVRNNLSFYPGITFEDTQLMAYALSKASKVAALTKFSCYNYIQRSGSIMNSALTKHKLFSTVVIVNSHINYAKEFVDSDLKDYFMKSASAAFMDGIKKIVKMGADKELLNEYLSKIENRPYTLFGKNMIQRLYQFAILHFPYTFIKIINLIKL